jgi:hypothetical protein
MTVMTVAALLADLTQTIMGHPEQDWSDALCHGRMFSEAWAVDHLARIKRDLGVVYILGSGHGTLASLLMAHTAIRLQHIRSFDKDPTRAMLASKINLRLCGPRFRASPGEMRSIDLCDVRHGDNPDTIINTAVHRLPDLAEWWKTVPNGRLVLLQSRSDMTESLAWLCEQVPMREPIYHGSHRANGWERYMVLGVK